MNYTKEEVIQYINEDDVKFIRLAFCDVYGNQKNISIMPTELERAFEHGIAIDASAITGFGDEQHSDLFLFPDPETLMYLPWRPEHGKVMRMYTTIKRPDGSTFECDTRSLLKKAVSDAKREGYTFFFGAEQEFYLFNLDEEGNPTKEPHDNAGSMDVAPADRGENMRREICLTLEQMGIQPESSHHEEGPGQNEIDFHYSDALSAADNVMTFQNVVKTAAFRNGLYADFSAKPFDDKPGNGFHINMSVRAKDEGDHLGSMTEGVLNKIKDITAFLNPTEDSYKRFGLSKAPAYISWAEENRSQLIRIPASKSEYSRIELRSPDPMANPYLAFTLLIYAGLYGIKNKLKLREANDLNLYSTDEVSLSKLEKLPVSRAEAIKYALKGDFVKEHIPAPIMDAFLI